MEALERGDFDNLPGAGRPLLLDDDSHIPESLRMAYRVMKNAGVLPPELDLRREIATVQTAIKDLPRGEPRAEAIKRLNLLRATLAAHRGHEWSFVFEEKYLEATLSKLEQHSP